MAVMIPDACPSKATGGEQRLYRFLQTTLPDDFTVWYEPAVHQRHPDFAVFCPSFGLLLIEVKDWHLETIRKADPTHVELAVSNGDGAHVERVDNPLRQVREYAFSVMHALAAHPKLRQPGSEHEGKLCFPVGYGVFLSNITRRQVEDNGLTEVFPPAQFLCKDEAAQLEAAQSDREVIVRLRHMFAVTFPFEPLTKSQAKRVRATLHREVLLHAPAPDGGLAVLDEKQEQVAKSLGEGHRVFFGVAGSGKTVLLLARAKMLAEKSPDARVLVLCYNRALSEHLGSQLADHPCRRRIEVSTYHSWASRRTGLRKAGDEDWDAYAERVTAHLLEAATAWPDERRYDAVLVDEAHDFRPDWFRCCVQAVRGGEAGDLLVAVDGAQSLYKRTRKFTWKSVGVQAQGRSRRLSTNYRNTLEVLDFAWNVTQAHVKGDEEEETHVRVRPTVAVRKGPLPVYRPCADEGAERAAVVGLVERFQAAGLAGREVCVLYPYNKGKRADRLFDVLQEAGPAYWVAAGYGDRAGGVRLCTVHSAKGLEFRGVVFTALDQLPDGADDPVTAANLLYVGLTRAMEHLAVTWCRRSEFTDRVERSPKAVLLSDA